MKILIFCILSITFRCSSTSLSIYETIAKDLTSENTSKTIAVLPFEVNPNLQNENLIAERLTHELVKLGNYQVIERSKIDRILKEQSLSQIGITSKDDSMKIGKLLSAEGVVVGSIIQENGYTTILSRIVDTSSGKIWSSSRVSYLAAKPPKTSNSNQKVSEDQAKPDHSQNSKISFSDDNHKSITSSEKPTGEVKDLQLIRNGEFGRFLGLLKNTGSSPFSGNKLYVNLKDKQNTFLDTASCFTDKPAYPGEEVPFSCIFSNFPSNYSTHEIIFEPENRFYGAHTPFQILSEKFKYSSGALDGYTLTGIVKNNTEVTITYPKIILSLFDKNKKFIGAAIGFSNQKNLAPGETSSFKVSAYSYSLAGQAKTYKVQTSALVSRGSQ